MLGCCQAFYCIYSTAEYSTYSVLRTYSTTYSVAIAYWLQCTQLDRPFLILTCSAPRVSHVQDLELILSTQRPVDSGAIIGEDWRGKAPRPFAPVGSSLEAVQSAQRVAGLAAAHPVVLVAHE